MPVRAAFDTNQIDIAFDSDGWCQFANTIAAYPGTFPLVIGVDIGNWDTYLSTLQIEQTSDKLLFVQCTNQGVLLMRGPREALFLLAENARDMVHSSVGAHDHVDHCILPDLISESSALMIWRRENNGGSNGFSEGEQIKRVGPL